MRCVLKALLLNSVKNEDVNIAIWLQRGNLHYIAAKSKLCEMKKQKSRPFNDLLSKNQFSAVLFRLFAQ